MSLPLLWLMVAEATPGSYEVYSGPNPCFSEPAFTQTWMMS